MSVTSSIRTLLRQKKIHPRRWLRGLISYSRYLGYVRPQLMTASKEEFLVRRKLLARAWEPRHLVVPVGKRLLALCPHPDDESIGAGGLLLAHRNLAEIHLVCLCNGEGGGSLGESAGDPEATKRALIETRKTEFRKIAHTLNVASVRHLDFPDGGIPCSTTAAEQLRAIVQDIRPDTVLLPWFLDNHVDHCRANVLYAWGCADLQALVLGYEVWSLLEPNAVLDITPHLDAKLALIRNYESQLRTVDYVGFASGLARVRAYQFPTDTRRAGAVEAYVALPNHEYCSTVCQLYGEAGCVKPSALSLLDLHRVERASAAT